MFEHAKWITRKPWKVWSFPKNRDNPPSPYLARNFSIDKANTSRVILSAVGYGQAAYYLNGSRIPNSLLPTQPTDPTVTVFYNQYDITDLVCDGENRLGILLGKNDMLTHNAPWYSFVKMIAQLDITQIDGSVLSIVSDSSFRTADSPLLYDQKLIGETYDARLEIPGWCTPGFDDSSWDPAQICRGPGGRFEPLSLPAMHIMREIVGEERSKGVFDFHTNTSGWVRLSVKGKAGEKVLVKYAERLQPDGQNVDRRWIMHSEDYHTDSYVLKGDPNGETWEPQVLYHGFRYAQVLGNVESVSLTAVVVYSDLPEAASFECDNPIFNTIHNACRNSILTNCHGVLTDCPHREQAAWTGDAATSAEVIALNFDAEAFFRPWLHLITETQLADGQILSCVPGTTWHRNFACGIDWDSVIIHLPYFLYRYTGNLQIVRECWPAMQKVFRYFSTQSESFLMPYALGDWGGFSPEHEDRIAPSCSAEFCGTCCYYLAARRMAELAQALGEPVREWADAADSIRREFRRKYVQNGSLHTDSDTAMALAVFAGLLDSEEAVCEVTKLAELISSRGNRICCGMHGIRTVFDVLSDYGYDELIFRILTNENAPGYARIYTHGMDTVPETLNFDVQVTNSYRSLNHHFFAHVDTWFYKSLAGIRLKGFGYREVCIDPHFVSGVSRVKAQMHGIRVEYDEKALSVQSPFPFTFQNKRYPQGSYCFPR